MSVPTPEAPAPAAPLPTLGELDSRWTPPPGATVTAHSGKPLPTDLVYLEKPPQEIGAIRTAFSTIVTGRGADHGWPRRIGFGLAFAAVLVLMSSDGCKSLGVASGNIPFMGLWAVAGIAAAYFLFNPRNGTTYVGERGVCDYIYKGKSAYPKISFVPFDQVNDLTVAFTDHYTRGIYTHSDYKYKFAQIDSTGKPVVKFTINGWYRRSNQPPKDEYYHFGLSAERAFSRFHLPLCHAILREGKPVIFRVVGSGALHVTQQGLKIVFNNKEEMIPKEEIANLNIAQGTVTIARNGAKKGILGIGSSGIYSFAYSNLSNARLFLALLSDVIGQAAPDTAA